MPKLRRIHIDRIGEPINRDDFGFNLGVLAVGKLEVEIPDKD
ncbi:hypothetical protein LCGC14_2080920 [marine sediment metagenome]|uniref:Uncharacterized protein n=1 Tax=marine sediment metagenome TaxID=412755 RepID=A0A0F9F304_9ZZZZ